MIRQIGPPTFFVTLTSPNRILSKKTLHTLHAKKLNLPNKIKDFYSIHIAKLIHNDL
jgi:hypothetical protein